MRNHPKISKLILNSKISKLISYDRETIIFVGVTDRNTVIKKSIRSLFLEILFSRSQKSVRL